MTLYLW